MLNKLLFSLAVPVLGVCASPFNFGTPIVVPGSSGIDTDYSQPVVASSSLGFAVCWQDGSTNVWASNTTNLGSTWNSDMVDANSSAYPNIAGNGDGFLVTWIYVPPGYASGFPSSSLYDKDSLTWSDPEDIDGLPDQSPPVFVGNAGSNFIAVWQSIVDSKIFVNVTSDGTTWLGSSPQVATGVDIKGVTACGNNDKYIVAWNDLTDNKIRVAYSSDSGTTWEPPYDVIDTTMSLYFGCVGSFANQDGFLLVYSDNGKNLWSIFSVDGLVWSDPTLIATDLLVINYFIPAITNTDKGFVVAWVDENNNGFASLSSNNGGSWSSPSLITAGDIDVGNYNGVSISAYQNQCMAAWVNGSNEVLVSVSGTSSTPSINAGSLRGFNYTITPNNPGFGLNR
jgi:hypothetical protein